MRVWAAIAVAAVGCGQSSTPAKRAVEPQPGGAPAAVTAVDAAPLATTAAPPVAVAPVPAPAAPVVEEVAAGASTFAMALAGQRVCFFEWGERDTPNQVVACALRAGGAAEKIASITGSPIGMAAAGDALLWLDPGERRIGPSGTTVRQLPTGVVKRRDESGRVTTVMRGLVQPFALAAAGRQVFALAYSPDEKLVRLVRARATTMAARAGLQGLAADDRHVYVGVGSTIGADGAVMPDGMLLRFPAGGGRPKTLASDLRDPRAIALDGPDIFVAGRYDVYALANGAPARALASDQAEPIAIAVDPTHVYWVCYQGGTVARVSRAGGQVETLASGQTEVSAVAVDHGWVYFAVPGAIRRVAKPAR